MKPRMSRFRWILIVPLPRLPAPRVAAQKTVLLRVVIGSVALVTIFAGGGERQCGYGREEACATARTGAG